MTLVLVLLPMLACTAGAPTGDKPDPDDTGETDTTTDSDSAGDTDTDSDTDTCAAVGFADEPTAYTLPDAPVDWALPWYQLYQNSYDNTCADGSIRGDADWYWGTFDLTGDGLADIVVYKDSCNGTDIGTSRWEVYENTGTGFATTPTDWALPTASVNWTNPWYQPSEATSGNTCADGSGGGTALWYYTLLDLDGDGLVDLVVTADTCTSEDVGTSRWDVYRNTGAGFETTPTTWTLPAAPVRGDNLYYTTSASYLSRTCTDGSWSGRAAWYWTLLDLSGDGAPDLVHTVDTCDDGEIGGTLWTVYTNNGAGFDETPIDWALPARATDASFPYITTTNTEYGRTCADGTWPSQAGYAFTTLDIDGDAAPDLVHTYALCVGTDVGADRWAVYRNNGGGFDASPTDWPVPATSVGGWPWILHAEDTTWAECADGSARNQAWYHTLMDLTGDTLPDLVVTWDECTGREVGTDFWTVYPNNGAGFDATGLEWNLPTSSVSTSLTWYRTSISNWGATCTDGTQAGTADHAFSVFRLDDDEFPDLVLTVDSCGDDEAGVTHWNLYPGTCGS